MNTPGIQTFQFYAEETPNPETMKFVSNRLLYPGKNADFRSKEEASTSPLAQQLFEFPFIKSVFIASDFITITKTENLDSWNKVTRSLEKFLTNYLQKGGIVINEEEYLHHAPENGNQIHSDDDDVVKKIKEMLELYIKPAVEMDGGAIEFLSYNNGILNLKMHGACMNCPSSNITLKSGIETIMKQKIPKLKEVISEES